MDIVAKSAVRRSNPAPALLHRPLHIDCVCAPVPDRHCTVLSAAHASLNLSPQYCIVSSEMTLYNACFGGLQKT